jgi:hypothetical protein
LKVDERSTETEVLHHGSVTIRTFRGRTLLTLRTRSDRIIHMVALTGFLDGDRLISEPAPACRSLLKEKPSALAEGFSLCCAITLQLR